LFTYEWYSHVQSVSRSNWSCPREPAIYSKCYVSTLRFAKESQGACLAIEDAVVLAGCLQSAQDIRVAFRRYEKCRHRRCLEIYLTSREVGRFAQFQNRAAVKALSAPIELQCAGAGAKDLESNKKVGGLLFFLHNLERSGSSVRHNPPAGFWTSRQNRFTHRSKPPGEARSPCWLP
jgi:hypothetical protein